MTTWPSGTKASTANLDSGTDKPRLARTDIKQNVDNVNDIVDFFNGGGNLTVTGDQLTFTKGYAETINGLTSSTGITVNANTATVHSVLLEHNTTFTFSNMSAGQSVSVIVTQDSTGSNTGAFANVLFPFGITKTLSTGANDIDIVNVFSDGNKLYGHISRNFA